jgi:hypothetical protein
VDVDEHGFYAKDDTGADMIASMNKGDTLLLVKVKP